MSASVSVQERQQVWDTFEADREALYDQYEAVAYDVATGRSPEQLREEIEAYLRAHPAEPHIAQKAHAFRHVLSHAQIHLDLFDWLPDKFNHGHLLRELGQRSYQQAKDGPLAEDQAWFATLHDQGLGYGVLDVGHIAPSWDKLFSVGLEGLIAEATWYRAQCSAEDVTRRAFYRAVVVVCEGCITLSQRFADLAESMADEHPDYRQRLLAIAEACRRVPARSPRTLHEALCFAWLMHELIEFEGESVRSLGRFDQLFYPYYLADLEAGQVTREQAKELFKFYWMKSYARTRGIENGAHFCMGGQLADGSDAVNELTYLLLDAYEELNTPDPKLSVRCFSGSPHRLHQRVLDLIRQGHNAMVLINDEAVVPALRKQGKTLEDARSYVPIGCYEPAVDGKEAACTGNLTINLAKAVELALHDGADPLTGVQAGPHTGDPRRFTRFASFLQAYMTQLDSAIERSAAAISAHERLWAEIHPSPLVASSISDCMTRGRDVGEGGCLYNGVGSTGVGLANAADSLQAIKRAVFDEGRYTLGEIIEALRDDYEGHEPMRQYLIGAAPKWGNGDAEVDSLARTVADHYCAKIHTFANERGGTYNAALYSFLFQWSLGKVTGALPDGRKAHTPLAPGVGATPGRDKAGITALLESALKLDYTNTPNGSVLDVRLHPSSVTGVSGLKALTSLTRTYFDRGGFALQFNVMDAETLRAAQRDPEAYATLQVRVAGYSAYFVYLSRDMQDQMIAQYAHSL